MNIEQVNISELTPFEQNPREISDKAINAVAESIKQNGFNQPVVANQDNVICVGHTRWLAAKKLGLEIIPVFRKNMTDAEFKKYNIADNKTGEFSLWNVESLSELLEELKEDEVDLSGMGFSETELETILAKQDGIIENENIPPENEPPAENKGDKSFTISMGGDVHDDFLADLDIIKAQTGESSAGAVIVAVERYAESFQ